MLSARKTLSTDNWELIVIDNASLSPLGSSLSLNWHPHARVVQEPELGLTPARVRGIQEAIGDSLVLVDDDNLLASDYRAQVIAVASASFLGLLGHRRDQAGICGPSPDWTREFWGNLAVRTIECHPRCGGYPIRGRNVRSSGGRAAVLERARGHSGSARRRDDREEVTSTSPGVGSGYGMRIFSIPRDDTHHPPGAAHPGALVALDARVGEVIRAAPPQVWNLDSAGPPGLPDTTVRGPSTVQGSIGGATGTQCICARRDGSRGADRSRPAEHVKRLEASEHAESCAEQRRGPGAL